MAPWHWGRTCHPCSRERMSGSTSEETTTALLWVLPTVPSVGQGIRKHQLTMLGPGATAEGEMLYTTIAEGTVGRPKGLVYLFF